MLGINKDFDHLFDLSKKIKLLTSVNYLLEWDQETYMPKKAAKIRAEQIELMAGLIHKEQTSSHFQKALSKLIDLESGKIQISGLSLLQKAALKRWNRDFLIAKSLPNSFVKHFAKLCSEGMIAWQKAREESQFSLFAPFLENIVSMCREKAEYLGYSHHPYDALLDYYEPELTTLEVNTLFTNLKNKIEALLKKIQLCPEIDNQFLFGKFSEQKQMEFSKILLKTIGYDLEKGRLDRSAHPFSAALHPSDSRITTRIHPSCLYECISAVLHEAGHGLYEMGLASEHYGSPLCEAISLGIHESQSRFWETRIGLSKPFWKYFYPILKKTFKTSLQHVSLEKFYKGINKVEPSLIRIESDEISYSLHVILRFELEKQLIEGSLLVSDLPAAWNEMMEKLLGTLPKNDREGCLQDIHWSMGAFGYFPTYTLGNLYASFFFECFEKDHPDWEEKISHGEFIFIREWLRDKIHRHGRLHTAKELAKKIAGKPLSVTPYLNYLEKKYQQIYAFD